MSKEKIEEMRKAMKEFYSNATDEEFWEAIKAADMGVYSRATCPEQLIAYCSQDMSIVISNAMLRNEPPAAFSRQQNESLDEGYFDFSSLNARIMGFVGHMVYAA